MLLRVGIILIIISIIVLIFLSWWYSDPPSESPNYPTMHSRCRNDPSCDGTTCVSQCGGDLTCDKICHRCKKTLGGTCSSTVDCETGLICHNWKCQSNNSPPNVDIFPPDTSNSIDKKQVHWADKNEIFFIPMKK